MTVLLKTPKEMVATIQNAAMSSLHNPTVSKRLRDLGYVLIGAQPEEFAAHIKSEIEKPGETIRRTGVTAE